MSVQCYFKAHISAVVAWWHSPAAEKQQFGRESESEQMSLSESAVDRCDANQTYVHL